MGSGGELTKLASQGRPSKRIFPIWLLKEVGEGEEKVKRIVEV